LAALSSATHVGKDPARALRSRHWPGGGPM